MTYLSVHHVIPLLSIGTSIGIEEFRLYERIMVSVRKLKIVLEMQASIFAPLQSTKPDTAEK